MRSLFHDWFRIILICILSWIFGFIFSFYLYNDNHDSTQRSIKILKLSTVIAIETTSSAEKITANNETEATVTTTTTTTATTETTMMELDYILLPVEDEIKIQNRDILAELDIRKARLRRVCQFRRDIDHSLDAIGSTMHIDSH